MAPAARHLRPVEVPYIYIMNVHAQIYNTIERSIHIARRELHSFTHEYYVYDTALAIAYVYDGQRALAWGGPGPCIKLMFLAA